MGSDPHDVAERERRLAERIAARGQRDLAQRSLKGSVVYPLLAAMGAALSPGTRWEPVAWPAAATLAALGAVRFIALRRFLASPEAGGAPLLPILAPIAFYGLYVAGLWAWVGETPETLLWLLTTAGISAGLTSAFASMRSMHTAGILLLCLPVVVAGLPASLASGSPVGTTMMCMTALFIVVIVRDGAEAHAAFRTLIEQQFDVEEARDRAEQADQAKMRFLANMSHELRTPLNGILGLTELARGDAKDPAQKERLALVHGSGEALLALLNDILDFSKIHANQLQFESVAFDPEELLRQTAALHATVAQKKGLALRTEIAPLPKLLRGDPTRIRQVLANLLGNAVKFTEAGEVRLHVSSQRDSGDAHTLTLAVSDTGVGISQERLETIFEPFTQADESTTRRFGGTGLGLTIAKRIAQGMGGDLAVESTLGEGACFVLTVTLPAATTDEERVTFTPALSVAPLAARRVLVAEDNAVNATLVRQMLGKLGLEVTVVRNGALAVDAQLADAHDLVLMDLQMPEMDGIEATRALRAAEEKRGLRPVPIVALTAHALREDERRSRDAGMNGYLSKPVRLPALRNALAQHLPERDAGRLAS